MKKIIPILLVAITTIMLSSCIIIAEEPKYTIYFYNDTYTQHVYDWYVKDADGYNHVASKDYCMVAPGEYDYIDDLSKDYYEVWFCVYSSRSTDLYLHTNQIKLDRDTTFRLAIEEFIIGSPRTVADITSIEETDESKFVLIDSEGNTYQLFSANE